MSEKELRESLKLSLRSERKALLTLQSRDMEIAELKNKVRLYERRFDKIRNFLPVKMLIKSKNLLKGLK